MKTAKRLAFVGDIGCETVRFAISDIDNASISHFVALQTAAFDSLADAIAAYYRSVPYRPQMVGFSVDAPMADETVQMPNSSWMVSADDISRTTGAEHVQIVGGAKALALALPNLPQHELKQVGEGIAREGAPRIILSVGADFGAAALIRSGDGWTVLNSEFDKAPFAVVDEAEFGLLGRPACSHATVGLVLSPRGLVEMYAMFAASKDGSGLQPSAPQVLASVDCDAAAKEAVGLFASVLVRTAANLALAFSARGGVYLGGKIAGMLADTLGRDLSQGAFKAQVCTERCPEPIPVLIITASDAGLRGAATALADACPATLAA